MNLRGIIKAPKWFKDRRQALRNKPKPTLDKVRVQLRCAESKEIRKLKLPLHDDNPLVLKLAEELAFVYFLGRAEGREKHGPDVVKNRSKNEETARRWEKTSFDIYINQARLIMVMSVESRIRLNNIRFPGANASMQNSSTNPGRVYGVSGCHRIG